MDVEGRVVFEKGKANAILSERSRWVDLVVSPLNHDHLTRDSRNPTGSLPLSFRPLLQHCRTPFLALPGPFTFPTRALLAYDGSQKAEEALFMAAYLASFWGMEVVIFSVLPTEPGQATRPDLDYAQTYLRRYQIDAPVCYVHGETAPEILRAAQEYACDLILMGGYGEIPLFGGFRRRTVDAVLAGTQIPVLICR
jgi:nucleotide-binding universal stress UspA family protein